MKHGTTTKPSSDRLEVLARIRAYEKEGGESFFRDVENDPPSRTLMPHEVDYLNRAPKNRLRCFLARFIVALVERPICRSYSVRLCGTENLKELHGGAVFTSNHFSQFENLAVKAAADRAPGRHRFYRVVREGNFFMKGLVGFLLRYCDTLPLSSSIHTMRAFNCAVDELLHRGDFLLIYPEQSMWWNYRKPRPYRNGAFYIAARCGVPVVPCFVTMEDGNRLDKTGFPRQRYTVHVMHPIYPSPSVPPRKAAEEMMEQNRALTKAMYESVYGIPLTDTQ